MELEVSGTELNSKADEIQNLSQIKVKTNENRIAQSKQTELDNE
jgi:hypothetical protein